MRVSRKGRVREWICLGLLLCTLMGSGVAEYAGHDAAAIAHAGPTTRLLADHDEPDSTLHLEGLEGERLAFCPGCLLKRQLGGSHLPHSAVLERPVAAEHSVAPVDLFALFETSSPRSSRGPPSC